MSMPFLHSVYYYCAAACMTRVIAKPECPHSTSHSQTLLNAASLIYHTRAPAQHTVKMGRVRTKTVKKSAKVIIERYYPKLTLDFETNKRICDEIAVIASKRLRNKVRTFLLTRGQGKSN